MTKYFRSLLHNRSVRTLRSWLIRRVNVLQHGGGGVTAPGVGSIVIA